MTLTDRKSRYQIIRLIPDKSAFSVNQALKAILKDYQTNSITADNGAEFSRLEEVFDPTHIYYAHPYSSWERGTNENHNRPSGVGYLREAKMRLNKVAFIENWINNYPKKLFNYKSPKEFLQAG